MMGCCSSGSMIMVTTNEIMFNLVRIEIHQWGMIMKIKKTKATSIVRIEELKFVLRV
jgi:hypothetical protein